MKTTHKGHEITYDELSEKWICEVDGRRLTSEKLGSLRQRIDALLAYDGSDILRQIGCPTLVVGSADDAIIPVTQQIALHKALQSHAQGDAGQARLHDFGHGGHFFPVSRTRDFCSVVAQWLGDVS
jgi:pimeloyl-ACP methyl ester carboxylesterase